MVAILSSPLFLVYNWCQPVTRIPPMEFLLEGVGRGSKWALKPECWMEWSCWLGAREEGLGSVPGKTE